MRFSHERLRSVAAEPAQDVDDAYLDALLDANEVALSFRGLGT